MFGWFWKESIWLPANTTWDDISNGPGKSVVYAEAKEFWVLIPMVAVELMLRFLSERYVFSPFGCFLKISDFKCIAPPNAKLEAEYRKSPSSENVTALAKQLDLSEREIARWWRLRRDQDKPTTLVKFCESMWRGCHYLLNVSLGFYMAWGEDWVKDVDKCFDGHPHQGVTSEIRWYFMIISTFYICLTITQFRDVHRKDYWQLFIHHLVALSLLFLSWTCQCFRMSCLVQVLHEVGNIMLEFGKAAKYARLRSVLKGFFAVFVLMWVVTRLVLFPVFILSTAYRHRNVSPIGFFIFNLLALLFALSCLWTWLIYVMVRRFINTGNIPTDVRSSDSEDSDVITDQTEDNKNTQLSALSCTYK